MSAAPSPVHPHPPDPFQLTARVAHGGMATIYAGTLGGEPIAVKLLHPHLAEDPHIRAMFLHEANLASRLEHENVVRVFAHGEHPVHGAYLLMELLEGGDLSGLLKAAATADRRLPPTVVARLVVDLCRGLEAAHSLTGEDGAPLRLIHRDVSPHNLLVGTDGVGRLTDFGIAKSDERYTMTRPGQLKGKLSYMAPEQLAHEDALDRRVDVFAAGVVLWEALLGRRLFKGDDEISVINKVLLEKVPPPSTLDASLAPLDEVTLSALARERDDRFPTAAAFADALEAAAAPLGGLASREEVGALVRELLGDQLLALGAKIERASLTPSGIPPAVSGSAITETAAAPRGPMGSSSRGRWALVALLVLAAAGLGAAVTWLGRPDPPTPPAAALPPPPEPTPVSTPPLDPPRPAPPIEATPAPAPVAEAPPPPQETLPVTRARRDRPAAPAPPPIPPPAVAPGPPPDLPTGPEPRAPRDDLYPNPFRD